MLIVPPFYRRKSMQASAEIAPPVAFALVSAEYAEASTITLAFSKPINIDGLDGGQIFVDDGETSGSVWQGAGEVELIDPQTISIGLTEYSSSMSSGVFLDASAGNGIVAADGSGAWAGASNLPLPFG